jgi:hypothetical protein
METIALIGDRSPGDAAKCEQDLCKWTCAINFAKHQEKRIVFVSGREVISSQTANFGMARNSQYFFWWSVYEKVWRSSEKTASLSKKKYNEFILDKYNVAFGTRTIVSSGQSLARSLSLTCLQVEYGDLKLW